MLKAEPKTNDIFLFMNEEGSSLGGKISIIVRHYKESVDCLVLLLAF